MLELSVSSHRRQGILEIQLLSLKCIKLLMLFGIYCGWNIPYMIPAMCVQYGKDMKVFVQGQYRQLQGVYSRVGHTYQHGGHALLTETYWTKLGM